jgi:hypothetical protein
VTSSKNDTQRRGIIEVNGEILLPNRYSLIGIGGGRVCGGKEVHFKLRTNQARRGRQGGGDVDGEETVLPLQLISMDSPVFPVFNAKDLWEKPRQEAIEITRTEVRPPQLSGDN